jgi:hypothetical protein
VLAFAVELPVLLDDGTVEVVDFDVVFVALVVLEVVEGDAVEPDAEATVVTAPGLTRSMTRPAAAPAPARAPVAARTAVNLRAGLTCLRGRRLAASVSIGTPDRWS